MAEGDETLTLTLSSPSNATLGSPNPATLKITDVTPTDYTTKGSYPNTDPGQGLSITYGTAKASPQDGGIKTVHGKDVCECECGSTTNDQGQAVEYTPNLTNDTQSVSRKPIVQTTFASAAGDSVPTQIQTRLTWNGGTPQSWVTFSTSGHAQGDTYLFASQVSSAVTATGRYAWTIEVVATFSGPRRRPPHRHRLRRGGGGRQLEQPPSAGAGASRAWTSWSASRGGVLWVYGSGGSRYFASAGGGTFTSPANDLGTLVQNGDNTYTYTAPTRARSTSTRPAR